ncbi:hypothetical protein ACO0LO_27155 [Undibacterium sp. TJN25]|uniref:hypothetical protein n=1 Tax=Undibacterium sp. TJN25 TaxID=3413056 RepID=UPI003BEFFA43
MKFAFGLAAVCGIGLAVGAAGVTGCGLGVSLSETGVVQAEISNAIASTGKIAGNLNIRKINMWLLGLEAGTAMFLLIFIVWWTMFSGKKPEHPPQQPPVDNKEADSTGSAKSGPDQ